MGDRITDGVVICKHGQEGTLRYSTMVLAAHPIPDEAGLEGARRTLALARQTRPGDLVLCCYTGEARRCCLTPRRGSPWRKRKPSTGMLLSCGANIIEINAVRKHLSRIKGGRLAAAVHPRGPADQPDGVGRHRRPLGLYHRPDRARHLDPRRCAGPPFPNTICGIACRPRWRNFLNSAGPDRETP